MNHSRVLNTDYYVISDDFRLLDFNRNVQERYTGIKRGDLCYQATMKRDSPCPPCPIAAIRRVIARCITILHQLNGFGRKMQCDVRPRRQVQQPVNQFTVQQKL